jgi:hypothetical protein
MVKGALHTALVGRPARPDQVLSLLGAGRVGDLF